MKEESKELRRTHITKLCFSELSVIQSPCKLGIINTILTTEYSVIFQARVTLRCQGKKNGQIEKYCSFT